MGKSRLSVSLILSFFTFQIILLPYSSYSDVSLSDYDTICSTVLSQPASSANSQKLSYCQAAQTAQQSANTSGILWKVWGIVAATCGAICAASFGGVADPVASGLCVAANVGATGVDALETKQYMNAVMNLGMTLGPGIFLDKKKKTQKSAEDEAKNSEKAEKDLASCIAAAYAAYQAYNYYTSVQSSQSTEISSLTQAQSVQSTSATTDAASSSLTSTNPTGTSGSLSTSVGNSSSSTDSVSNTMPNTSAVCSGSGSSSTVGQMVACATASDATLPSAVNTTDFGSDFNKTTGGDLAENLNNAKTPVHQMASAFGGGGGGGGILSTEASAALVGAFQDFGTAFESGSLGGAGYSGGGGGGRGRGSSSSNDDGLMSMMAGMFGQLQGSKGGDSNSGLAQVIFANQKKSPTAVAEDRKLSIFDRITYRYHYSTLKMLNPPLKK